MGLEENMEKAREFIANYLNFHKSIGLSGLSKYGKISSKTISTIRYRDDDKLSDADIKKLINALVAIENTCEKQLNCMIADLQMVLNEQ